VLLDLDELASAVLPYRPGAARAAFPDTGALRS
jgi:hypothetical protein